MSTPIPPPIRWTLLALGTVDGPRVRRPRDAVAAWLLRRYPKLQPGFAAPSIVGMLRQRASIVDEMLFDALHQCPDAQVISFAAGLDARWYRLRKHLRKQRYIEFDHQSIMEEKRLLLQNSSFAEHWERVQTLSSDHWFPVFPQDAPAIFLLEGTMMRLGKEQLLIILDFLRAQASPRCQVILDLPGILSPPTPSPYRWKSTYGTGVDSIQRTEFLATGWRAVHDTWLPGRPEIKNRRSRLVVSSSIRPLRVLRLGAV